jgi:hypothetical protein
MINATNDSKPRELIPAGNYIARCYNMIHIGTVTEDVMGQPKTLNKVRITWELPTELRVFDPAKGEQPMVISKEFTLSMHEKANLRKDLESWRGKQFTEEQAKSFDITRLLGVACMLNIIHKISKTGVPYATISNISSIPKGLECPKQVNPTFEWNYEDHWDEITLQEFPDFIKDKIKTSEEYRKMKTPIEDLTNQHEPETVETETENDLPF